MTTPLGHQHHSHPMTDEEQTFVRALGVAFGFTIRGTENRSQAQLTHEEVLQAVHQALHQLGHIIQNHGIAEMQPIWERAAVDGYLEAGDDGP